MYQQIARFPVAVNGIKITFFNVYETEQGVYLAVPVPNLIPDKTYGEPYKEFYFSKVGLNWRSDPAVTNDILYEIVTGAGLPARPLNKWY